MSSRSAECTGAGRLTRRLKGWPVAHSATSAISEAVLGRIGGMTEARQCPVELKVRCGAAYGTAQKQRRDRTGAQLASSGVSQDAWGRPGTHHVEVVPHGHGVGAR
jgi:hypothetical protein